MKLSVVIVNYNVKHYLEQCLLSVQRALRGMDAEVFVVDNHSADGSVEFLMPRFPWVRFVASNHNLGFARANNRAIRMCKGGYVLLLNPDTIVAEHTLQEAVAWMDKHPDAGSLGVRMLDISGCSARESRRGVPTPMVAFYKMTGLCDRMPTHRRFGHYYMGYLAWDKPAQIEVVSGAFCMLRHSVLDRIGLLDEDFFMYGEDIDLSYRVLKGGFHNYYLPVPILHYKGESTQKSSFRYVHVFYEAMLIFFRKHNSGMSLILVLPINAAIYAKASLALVRMLASRIRKSLGFVVPRSKVSPLYLFIGRESSLAECREISAHTALEALFVEGDAESLPLGHLSSSVQEQMEGRAGEVYVVYDVSAYTYEQIFSIFMSAPEKNWKMATFDPSTHKIITDRDIMA